MCRDWTVKWLLRRYKRVIGDKFNSDIVEHNRKMVMKTSTIRRRLSGVNQKKEQFELNQTELLDQEGPIVVLGDAGMGKTTLLEEIGKEEGYQYVSARQIVRSNDPRKLLGDANCFVIDALDELAIQSEGDAVDSVLKSLGKAGYPKFILSCRVADWRSATNIQAFKDSYKPGPHELFLEPIRRKQARDLLAGDIGGDRAEAVLTHFERRGLDGLFGNPQTLMLIRSVADNDNLPDSKAALFDLAIKQLWAEHSQSKIGSPLFSLNESEALDAAGSAFSLLLLTGKRAVSRLPVFDVDKDDLPISEVKLIASKENLQAAIPSRLFTSNVDGDPDRFSYTHRSVGEFLAARWLASKADTDRKRRRLLSWFHGYGLVPTNLRGVHAWLAQNACLAKKVISADPMGVVEYGDTGDFSDRQACVLLDSLFKLRDRHPRYGSERAYSLRGIARPSLFFKINRMILCQSTPYPLRAMLLRSVTGTEIARMLVPTLKKMVLTREITYDERSTAASALVDLPKAGVDWTEIFTSLHKLADQNSLRLAIQLLPSTGFVNLSDRMIVELIVAFCGLSICAYPREKKSHMVGVLWRIENKLPCERIEPVLNILADYLSTLSGEYLERFNNDDVVHFISVLTRRRLEHGSVEPQLLCCWLSCYGEQRGPPIECQEKISHWFKENVEARRRIQRFVLLEQFSPKTVNRGLRLNILSNGLYPNESDIIEILRSLDPGSEFAANCWKDLVLLCPHDEERGNQVRKAAAPFATEQEGQEFLEHIANPVSPKWQIKQTKRKRREEKKKQKQWVKHRAKFSKHFDDLRAGKPDWLIAPAKVYLKTFSDIGTDVVAHKRIEKWLGRELQDAAFHGFESYLSNEQSTPTASQIATSCAEGMHWPAAYIFVVATAERVRIKKTLDDLTNDRLLAVFLEIRFSQVLDRAQISQVDEVVQLAVKNRLGLWKKFWKLRIEPQLNAQVEYVDGLNEFSRIRGFSAMVSELASEWLERFPNMTHRAEVALIDCLIAEGGREFLKNYVDKRRKSNNTDDTRRSNWDAVAFIVDYDAVYEDLSEVRGQSPDFMWCLRERFGRTDTDDTPATPLTAAQLAWTIRTFRTMFQPESKHFGRVVRRAYASASEYICVLIHRLGGLTSVDAVKELAALRDAPDDGYSDYLKNIFTEQAQKVIENRYVPLEVDQVAAMLKDDRPTSISQLREIMVEELIEVQKKIYSHPLDWYKDFFLDGVPKDEEACRDTLLKILGDNPREILCEPEGHLADNKRVDIQCTIDRLMLPIEIKGQWNKELWQAADTQLGRHYTSDWRAGHKGIYLVLWFGDVVPKNKRPRNTRGQRKRPTTANELRLALIENSAIAKQGNIEVFVMDMVRP